MFFSPNGGSARRRSNSRLSAASSPITVKTSCGRNSNFSGATCMLDRFCRIIVAWRLLFSTLKTLVAPRLKHSKPNAPEPLKRSSSRAEAVENGLPDKIRGRTYVVTFGDLDQQTCGSSSDDTHRNDQCSMSNTQRILNVQ